MVTRFKMPEGKYAKLGLDVIEGKAVKGIPAWLINPMEHAHIDRLAGEPEGSYRKNPVPVYTKMLLNSGCSLIDQFIPDNPLSMGSHGYEEDAKTRENATAGNKEIILDGMKIDTPEAMVEHMQKFYFPALKKKIEGYDIETVIERIVALEISEQAKLGSEMLKVPYAHQDFPRLAYGTYGYENYFMGFALFPDIIQEQFKLEAEYAAKSNTALARAHTEGGLPKLLRLDHDMADQKGTLVDIKVLDKIWFPHFASSIKPLIKAGVKLIWHCDGYLMEMFPRLLECGLSGFQGFQYEYGMEYLKICKMKTKTKEEPFIIAGVSVTTTLPFGKPEDIKKEMKFLVENGPKQGLVLGGSSSIAPGVSWENMKVFTEGLRYYREQGRK